MKDKEPFGVPFCDDCFEREDMYKKMAEWLKRYLKGEKLDKKICAVCGKNAFTGIEACTKDQESVKWLENLHEEFTRCCRCGKELSKKERMRIEVEVSECPEGSDKSSVMFACRRCAKRFWEVKHDFAEHRRETEDPLWEARDMVNTIDNSFSDLSTNLHIFEHVLSDALKKAKIPPKKRAELLRLDCQRMLKDCPLSPKALGKTIEKAEKMITA